MTIPISYDIQINPGVLSAGGKSLAMNGVMLTANTRVPIGQVMPFASADSVSAFFGPTSTEATLAAKYFLGYDGKTLTPGRLYFVQYPSGPVAAYLRGISVASLTLTQLQAITGTLIVTIDGATKTAASLNLSGAASPSAAAALIATALSLSGGQTCTYDSLSGAFVITSGTTGASSTITQATGTTAAALGLATGTMSQGAIAGVPATNMQALIAQTQNWATFMTVFEPDLANKQAFTAWMNSKNKRFVYVAWDTDANAMVANNTATFGAWLNANQPDGVIAISGDASVATQAGATLAQLLQMHAAFVCGMIASIDFARTNGRITLKWKTQPGLVPAVGSDTVASILTANGYNFYGAYATAADGFNYFSEAGISGSFDWADSFVNQIWLNSALQLALATLMTSIGSVPYNDDGYGLIEAACGDPIQAALNFGAIRKGVSLSTLQTAELKAAAGLDIGPAVTQQGYYLQVKDPGALLRGQRASPVNSLWYADGGAVHKLNLASVNVQ